MKFYYQCGCCEHYHRPTFTGDCRDDAERFTVDQLNEKHGQPGWEEISQEEADEILAREDGL